MPNEERPKTHIYESTVRKEYGLTRKMIEELGPPDEYVVNPHYKSGPPARLYLVSRVEAFVAANPERVQEAKANRAKRSAALLPSRQAKLAKREEEFRAEQLRRNQEKARIRLEARKWADAQALHISSLPDDLAKHVCEFFRWDRGQPTPTQYRSYVRQRLSNYDALREVAKKEAHFEEKMVCVRRRFHTEIDRVLEEWRRLPDRLTETSPPSSDTEPYRLPGSQ